MMHISGGGMPLYYCGGLRQNIIVLDEKTHSNQSKHSKKFKGFVASVPRLLKLIVGLYSAGFGRYLWQVWSISG
jgi:hypothetical protein